VGAGGMYLNQKPERGEVLYIALEDSPRRLKDRLQKMGIGSDAAITFTNTWRPLQGEGLNDLVIEMTSGRYRLMVLDTWTRSIPGVDQRNDAGLAGAIFDTLQRTAQRENVCFTVIDHTRKPSGIAADPVDDIINTSEKTQVADAIFALYKIQGKPGATLLGRGRDIAEVELALEWNRQTFCWQVGETLSTIHNDEILDALELLGKSKIGDISKALGQNQGYIFRLIQTLVDAGIVRREAIGKNIYYEKVGGK